MASQNQLALRKWWWVIPLALAIGVAGAFVSLLVVQREYEGTCRLFVSVPPYTSPGESYDAAQFGQARVAAYLDLIKGNRVAEGAISDLKLHMNAEDLKDRITAHADAESVVINVSVTDTQSQRSADLANAVCKAFLAVSADAEGPNSPINLRMIENASPPQHPKSPKAPRYLAAGALTGLLGGIGLALVLGRIWPPGGRPSEDNRDDSDSSERLDVTQASPRVAGESSGSPVRHRGDL